MGKLWPLLIYGALDIALAVAFSVLHPSFDKGAIFFFVLAAIWGMPIALGFWRFFKFWIGYLLFMKRRLVRIYKAGFHKAEFPAANGYFDLKEYLSSILDDEDLPQAAKTKAAYYIGQIDVYHADRPLTMGLAAQHAFEQAMEEYKP